MKNNSLLGFEITGWDWITFGVLAICILGGLAFIVWMMGLPGRIAASRKHPDAEAIKLLGYTGFLMAIPWIQAFIWAYKPTEVVDIRRFPKQEAEGIEEEIARLTGTVAKKEEKAPARSEETPAPKPPEAKEPDAGPDKPSGKSSD